MGYVYLLGDWEKDGAYKIGVTRGDVEKRIKKLQTGNCGKIYLVSTYETNNPFLMESMLHSRYAGRKILNEWFELTADEVIEFQKTCKEVQDTIDALKDNYFFKKRLSEK